jgi:hypothetical protein
MSEWDGKLLDLLSHQTMIYCMNSFESVHGSVTVDVSGRWTDRRFLLLVSTVAYVLVLRVAFPYRTYRNTVYFADLLNALLSHYISLIFTKSDAVT